MDESYNILYMEDDEGLARLLQKTLRRHGHEVDVAGDGVAGLRMLSESRYDLVLSDNEMPQMCGLEVIGEICKLDDRPPIIMVTGNGSEQIAIQALKKGAADYIVKDVDMRYLDLLPLVIEQVMRSEYNVRAKDRAIQELRENEERYSALVNLSPDGIAILTDGVVSFMNPAGMALLGGEPDTVQGKPFTAFIRPDCVGNFTQKLQEFQSMAANGTWIEEQFVKVDSGEVEVEFSGLPFVYQGKAAIQMIFRDITERNLAKRRLEYMARYDALTGLPNRALFFDRVDRALATCRRYPEACAIMFMDLDKFKQVNDTLGHDAGDDLLKQVSARLKGTIRECDTVARMGGDEFTMILTDVSDHGSVKVVAEKIVSVINEPFWVLGNECRIGVSIGISIYGVDGTESAALLKEADRALYYVKEKGRNGFCFASDLGK